MGKRQTIHQSEQRGLKVKTITTKDWIDLINENKQLNAQLAKANERIAELEKENKRESMELRSRLGSALGRNSEYNSAIENMQQKLAKTNERVSELELTVQKQSNLLEFYVNDYASKQLRKE